MSEPTQPTDAQQPTPTPATEQQQQQPGPVPYDRFAKVNEEAKQLKARLAELEAADKQRKEGEMTELQRWQKAAQDREAELAKERQDRIKLKVALAKGVPADAVEEFTARLRGDTEETIAADADSLLRFFAKPAAPQAPGVPPSRGSQPARLDINSMTPEEIRKNKAAVYRQAGIG